MINAMINNQNTASNGNKFSIEFMVVLLNHRRVWVTMDKFAHACLA